MLKLKKMFAPTQNRTEIYGTKIHHTNHYTIGASTLKRMIFLYLVRVCASENKTKRTQHINVRRASTKTFVLLFSVRCKINEPVTVCNLVWYINGSAMRKLHHRTTPHHCITFRQEPTIIRSIIRSLSLWRCASQKTFKNRKTNRRTQKRDDNKVHENTRGNYCVPHPCLGQARQ